MTKLTKAVRRETTVRYMHHSRPLIITLEGGLIRLREKGRRKEYSIDMATVYQMAARLATKAAQRESKIRGNRRSLRIA